MCVDLTIDSKTLPTTFFVINGKGSYSLMLGRDWIHDNCCIPSTMHQCLIQWIGDVVEVVAVDSSFSIASAEAYEWSYEKISSFSSQAWETEFLKIADYEMSSNQTIGSTDES